MPKVLGRYHIISELGRGGMGVVYKAVDPKLERFIAIKCLSEELSSDEITVTRFLREARNVAALNHPHIAQIYLADEDDGKPYFVMEFVDGESLADRLARDKRLLPEQARRIVTECAQALKAAHEENIVHRDIKPGNIMIDRRGRSVLTDFGIASVVHPDAEQVKSQYIMGTPGYLPPEVMTGKPADHRGDLFALGAVYYEMLAGKRLVPGSGLDDTARTLLAADFPELGDLDETLDEKTFGVLGRMLAPDPDKRYQSYDALLTDLGFAAAAETARPPVDSPTQASAALKAAASVDQPEVAASVAAATNTIDPTVVAPPTTQASTAPRSGSKAALLIFALLVLVGLGASGFAVVKFAPAQIERVAALLGMDTDDPARAGQLDAASSRSSDAALPQNDDSIALADEPRVAVDDPPTPPVAEAAAAQAAEPETSRPETINPETINPDASGPVLMGTDLMTSADDAEDSGARSREASRTEATGTRIEPMDLAEPSSTSSGRQDSPEALAQTDRSETAATVEAAVTRSQESDRQMASVERPVEPLGRNTRPEIEREPIPAPAAALPDGVLVIGLGDAAITDPMQRAIERALREEGHDLVERGFLSGLSALTRGDELDLNALTEVALNAGVRHVVVARALPAGQRQLTFYGRSDTAFMVQADTITYDLVERRRAGSTAVEQIEYTGLNATQKARDLIAGRLDSIRADLDP